MVSLENPYLPADYRQTLETDFEIFLMEEGIYEEVNENTRRRFGMMLVSILKLIKGNDDGELPR